MIKYATFSNGVKVAYVDGVLKKVKSEEVKVANYSYYYPEATPNQIPTSTFNGVVRSQIIEGTRTRRPFFIKMPNHKTKQAMEHELKQLADQLGIRFTQLQFDFSTQTIKCETILLHK